MPKLAIYSAFFDILVSENGYLRSVGMNPVKAIVVIASLMAFLLFLVED
ncbi:MAG: hypothetical protein HA491_02980 [Candidatus Verstraetearchaeota archaeon]|nr:hypothetical protein [Candidatus Verstraetearchaeota archaeon]